MKFKSSRFWSFFTLTLIYVAAFFIGLWTYHLAQGAAVSHFWSLFIADVAATVFVWFWGLVFKNVSVYDPYWSVLPPVMLTACAASTPLSIPAWLVIIALWIWGIRLTANWAYTFRNLEVEDWRYKKYRTEQPAFIFQTINFFGLNMMPTIVVFLALLPGLHLLDHAYEANPLTWFGFIVSIAAVILQLVADTSKHRFSKTHHGEICEIGLWKHGRHPNYLGEILMWWGIWIMFASVNPFASCGWYLVGPIAMTCLFLFISIPLMEHRQLQNKPGYEAYRQRTRRFI